MCLFSMGKVSNEVKQTWAFSRLLRLSVTFIWDFEGNKIKDCAMPGLGVLSHTLLETPVIDSP